MYDLTAMGARIRQLRTQKGLTQDGFAKELGISAQAVSKWETGAGCPDIAMLPLIAGILECSIDALFSDVAAPATPAAAPEEVPELALGPDMEDDLLERELNALSGEIDRQMQEAEREARFEEKMDEIEAKFDAKFADAERRFAEKEQKMEDGSYHFDRESYRAAHGEDNARVHLPHEAEAKAERVQQDATKLGDDIVREVEKTLESGDLSNLGTLISNKVNSIIDLALGKSRGERHKYMPTGSKMWQGADIRSLYLRTSGSADITVESGEPGVWRVEAEGSQEFLEHLSCTEDGSTLKIETTPYQQRNMGLFAPGNSIVIFTGFEDGEELDAELRGSGDMDCSVNFEVSRVATYGSGDIVLSDAGYLTVTASGSGDVTLTRGRNAVISSSGSCDVEIEALEGISEVKTSGSGDVTIGTAIGSLSFHTSGSGDLEVGDAQLEHLTVVASGAGDVTVCEGMAGTLDLTLRGAGDFDGAALTVGDLTAVLSGASDATVGRVTGSVSQRVGPAASLSIG
ncbi:MAG: helix-turn-helix domain-containing protein [Ruminococcaceae bacterium]|nr:helix-turn-helix domain-containing protein [Oscillospiraceae bacterium]